MFLAFLCPIDIGPLEKGYATGASLLHPRSQDFFCHAYLYLVKAWPAFHMGMLMVAHQTLTRTASFAYKSKCSQSSSTPEPSRYNRGGTLGHGVAGGLQGDAEGTQSTVTQNASFIPEQTNYMNVPSLQVTREGAYSAMV